LNEANQQQEFKMPNILVVDDEKNILRSVEIALMTEGHSVKTCINPLLVFETLKSEIFDLIIMDIRMGDIDGISIFQKMLTMDIKVPTIFISGHASLSEAVKAMKLGAFDFLEKPFSTDALIFSVKRCLSFTKMKNEIEIYKLESGRRTIIGESLPVRSILTMIDKVAPTNSTVFIQGETGTGKELVARQIHQKSNRADQAFVCVNCSAIPQALIESELFGHEKGAFTDAHQSKKGFFEIANHGTLFLDEIGDLSLPAQAKILRALQEGEIQKLGAAKTTKVDVRIIAATHKDLFLETQKQTFREDLYYRINVLPIKTVPLRQRTEDIPLLIAFFINQTLIRNGLKTKNVDPDLVEQLQNYRWPGNVRELQNIIERLVILSGEQISIKDLPEEFFTKEIVSTNPASQSPQLSFRQHRESTDREFLKNSLKNHQGNISQTAMSIGIERTYLHKLIAQLNISKRDYFL
jgi:two-component system nitrogen regulation response regulator NtrX